MRFAAKFAARRAQFLCSIASYADTAQAHFRERRRIHVILSNDVPRLPRHAGQSPDDGGARSAARASLMTYISARPHIINTMMPPFFITPMIAISLRDAAAFHMSIRHFYCQIFIDASLFF